MDRNETLNEIQSLIRDVLDDDSIALSFATVANDVPFWDSVAHVRIMIAVEKHFRIRFEIDELNSFEDVGGLVDGVIAKKTQ